MTWIETPWADAGEKLIKLHFKLEGTIEAEAYDELFPGRYVDEDMIPQYKIFGDKRNRQLMVAIYSNGKLNVDGLAKKLSLPTEDVQRRIEFFKANGLRRDVAKKYV